MGADSGGNLSVAVPRRAEMPDVCFHADFDGQAILSLLPLTGPAIKVA